MLSPTAIRTFRLALKSLLLHKLRSGLTMLGIVFGVFSVVAMLAIGEGASEQAQRQVRQLGATNIIVLSVTPPEGSSSVTSSAQTSAVLRYGLTRDDYRILRSTLTTVSGLVPLREEVTEVRYLTRSLDARVVGCTPDYLEMNHLAVSRGKFLAPEHLQDMANVAVIAAGTAERLFPGVDPVGQQIQIANAAYDVIGVIRPRTAAAAIGGSLTAQDYNQDVYIPLDTFQARINVGDLFRRRTAGNLFGSFKSVVYDQITLKVRDADDVLTTAEVVRETLRRTHGEREDTAVVVPLELLRQADQLRWIFNIVLGSIAAISLVVGGIGIMNIMLATVTERTREIGIRRALGARRGDIVRQFLTETIVLSGVGGLIGLGLGLMTGPSFRAARWVLKSYIGDASSGGSEIGRIFADMEPAVAMWSLPLAFGFSVAIGLIFGVYPARSAARLDPIEALRHE